MVVIVKKCLKLIPREFMIVPQQLYNNYVTLTRGRLAWSLFLLAKYEDSYRIFRCLEGFYLNLVILRYRLTLELQGFRKNTPPSQKDQMYFYIV